MSAEPEIRFRGHVQLRWPAEKRLRLQRIKTDAPIARWRACDALSVRRRPKPRRQPSGFCRATPRCNPAAPRCRKRPLRGLAHCRVNDVSKWVKPSSLNPGVPVVK
jgi:hypothetical protein